MSMFMTPVQRAQMVMQLEKDIQKRMAEISVDQKNLKEQVMKYKAGIPAAYGGCQQALESIKRKHGEILGLISQYKQVMEDVRAINEALDAQVRARAEAEAEMERQMYSELSTDDDDISDINTIFD